MATNTTNLVGEFYAMHRLLREGYEPALTLGNTKGIDILLYNPVNNKQFKVEVKTSRTTMNEKLFGGKNFNWRMHKKHETIIDSKLIYCFIYVPDSKIEMPRIFIVPSKDVAKYVEYEHDKWLKSHHDRAVKDTDMRSFRILVNQTEKFENNFSVFN